MKGGRRRPLRELEAVYATFEAGAGARKLELLAALSGAVLARPREVLRLHEILCFLRAYPDDAAILARAEEMLRSFGRRRDLRRHRAALADSGIAGTTIRFRFFAPQARWIASAWPNDLSIDWPDFDGASQLERLLPLTVLHAERAAFDDPDFSAKRWLARVRGAGGEAAFVLRAWDALGADEPTRSSVYDAIDPPLSFRLGPGTPARTREKFDGLPVVFQTGPLVRARPDLSREMKRPPRMVRAATPDEAASLIALARGSMLPRERDLEVFSYANPRDVRLVDAGDGLWFSCIGVQPERRSLLEAVYGFVMMKNGVSLGYALASALYRSSEVAYNVFETFRGGETALVFARLLATLRHLFGSTSFAIDPYQLGHHNAEGLESGAFWFYQKLGFSPRRPDILETLNGELAQIARDRSYRSGPRTLRTLASDYVFFHAGRPRADVLGALSMPAVALGVSEMIGRRFGGDRGRAREVLRKEALDLLGVRSPARRSRSADERAAWDRWAPLVAVLPGVEAWPAADRRSLAEIIFAKGGATEAEFLARFDAHPRLRAAVRRLSRTSP